LNPRGGEIFRTCPDRSWGPPSLLYHRQPVSFPGAKRPGRGVDYPPPSSTEVKERVELYLYSPSGSLQAVFRVKPLTLPFNSHPVTVLLPRDISSEIVQAH